jgi:hypothetical protein
MIRKTVERFSEEITRKQNPKRDGDSNQSRKALVSRGTPPGAFGT